MLPFRPFQEFVAKVLEQKKATDIYKESLQRDMSAGLVESDTRNANQIVVTVNVEPLGKAKFRLTYEDLLKRHLSKYQHAIHVNLDQVVEDFQIQVHINESLPVIQVHVPELKTDPNAIDSKVADNRFVFIQKNVDGDPSKVRILYSPHAKTQKKILESQERMLDLKLF